MRLTLEQVGEPLAQTSGFPEGPTGKLPWRAQFTQSPWTPGPQREAACLPSPAVSATPLLQFCFHVVRMGARTRGQAGWLLPWDPRCYHCPSLLSTSFCKQGWFPDSQQAWEAKPRLGLTLRRTSIPRNPRALPFLLPTSPLLTSFWEADKVRRFPPLPCFLGGGREKDRMTLGG